MMKLRARVLRYSNIVLLATGAVLVSGIGAATGCQANQKKGTTGGGTGATQNTTSTTGTGGTTTAGGAAGEGGLGGGLVGSGGNQGCDPGSPDNDDDGDGFSEKDGDCNDCNKNVNPGAAEVVAELDPNKPNEVLPDPADEDCDGKIDMDDADLKPCDGGLGLDSTEPMDVLKAIGFCDTDKDGKPKFIKKVSWVLADGLPPGPGIDMAKFHLGHGILDHFGKNDKPREGKQMLALSSGTARNKEDPGFVPRNFDKGYSSNPPLTFNGESPACPGVVVPKSSVQDAAGVELEFTAPTNVESMEFNFNFRTYEFPQFICSQFNDFFWANFVQGNTNKNVSFDDQKNAISVNAAFLSQCACPAPKAGGICTAPPFPAMGQPQKDFECKGTELLDGTDFDGTTNPGGYEGWTNGGSGWLKTTVPLTPKEVVKLRFVIFDSGIGANNKKDHNVDSTVLIDKFKWHAIPAENETIPE